ncbi:hypothetical protein P7C70_g1628, partial [Phenoliferia sp. Uapishka_3]
MPRSNRRCIQDTSPTEAANLTLRSSITFERRDPKTDAILSTKKIDSHIAVLATLFINGISSKVFVNIRRHYWPAFTAFASTTREYFVDEEEYMRDQLSKWSEEVEVRLCDSKVQEINGMRFPRDEWGWVQPEQPTVLYISHKHHDGFEEKISDLEKAESRSQQGEILDDLASREVACLAVIAQQAAHSILHYFHRDLDVTGKIDSSDTLKAQNFRRGELNLLKAIVGGIPHYKLNGRSSNTWKGEQQLNNSFLQPKSQSGTSSSTSPTARVLAASSPPPHESSPEAYTPTDLPQYRSFNRKTRALLTSSTLRLAAAPTTERRPGVRRQPLQSNNPLRRTTLSVVVQVGHGPHATRATIHGSKQLQVNTPVKAVVALVPAYYELRKLEDASVEKEGRNAEGMEGVLWFPQTIGNACGTYALIHALANAGVPLDANSPLLSIFAKARTLPPSERSPLLASSAALASTHIEAASTGTQTAVPAIEAKVDHHFVAFVEWDGWLVELDGAREGVLRRGRIEKGLLEGSMNPSSTERGCKLIMESDI